MKATYIFLTTFILLVSGCSLYKNIVNDRDMKIVNAGYHKWSDPPSQNSDLPEKGVDLAVIVENWPEDASPEYIVFEKRKSFKATVGTPSDIGTVINARIIRSSSVLQGSSEKVDVSDRMVYTDAEGEMQFIEIEEWTRIDN